LHLADILLEIFVAESLLLRVEKCVSRQIGPKEEVLEAILHTHFHDASQRIQQHATDALASFAEGDLLRTFLMGLKRFSKYPVRNVKALRRRVAAELIQENGYCF
jgi:hypothetical protein